MGLFDSFHQEKIFPVTMTSGESFTLDGEEYLGKPHCAGREFAPGEKAYVAFTANENPFGGPVGRRMPIIFSGATKRSWMVEGPYSITVDVVSWLQSNRDSKQFPLGARLSSAAYEPDPSSTSHNWRLPTAHSGFSVTSFRAYGLGRWQPDAGDDLYITAYPQRTSGGDHAICIGAWGVASRTQAWEANFGTEAGDPVQQDFRACQFFADPLSKFATVLPDPNTVPSRACSAKSASTLHETELDKKPWNASIHSFSTIVEGSPVVSSFLCLPGFESGTETVDFWQMNQTSGAWVKVASFPAEDLPDGGPTAVPDILPSGTDQTGSVSWTNNEALIPVSGGTRDILAPENWTETYLGVRGVKPDGTAGSRLASIPMPASSSPRILANASFQDQVLLAPFPLTYEFSGDSFLDNPLVYKVVGGIQVGPTTDSFYAKVPECPPIFMPPAGPNMQHLPRSQGLEVRMAYSNVKNWPTDDRTRPGRMPIDQDGVAWFCALVPEQVLYYSQHTSNVPGGLTFSQVDTGTTATVYFWTIFDDQTECLLGTSRGFGWNVNSTFHPSYGASVSTDPDDWPQVNTPCGNTEGTRRRSYSMEDKGTRPQFRFQLNLGLGILWRTKMFGLKPDNSLIELDVSQLQDVDLSVALGSAVAGGPGSGSTTYSVTESAVPTPDAVWDWAPVKRGSDKYLCILRDLHYERNGDCEPAPVLEIRNATTGAVLSTTRLGSQERREEDFLDETSGFSYREGDNVWNPYAYGAPRMKACQDSAGNPVILIMVGERKVVDVTTDPERSRVWYYSVKIEDPESPTVVERRQTSEAGTVGDPPGEPAFGEPGDHTSEFKYPFWRDWDTLVLTSGHVAWVRDSEFFEVLP